MRWEAPGQHVQQEAADELVRVKSHRLPAARAVDAIVLPAERDAGVVGCNEAAVRDGRVEAEALRQAAEDVARKAAAEAERAAQEVTLEAKRKSAPDARYAARKARRR
jgi:hypothetical protein